jgi:translation elongation factor EF-1beta
MNQHQEIILKWLLEYKLRPDLPSENACQAKIIELCGSQSEVWIQEINAALDNYLSNKVQIKQLDEDLIAFGVPESDSTVAATSSLLSVIKDFISMLNSSTFAYDSLQ